MKVILAKKMIDGYSKELKTNIGVVIEKENIVIVEQRDKLQPLLSEPGIEIIDAGDCTVMPGLIDTHVHLSFSASTNPLNEILAEEENEVLLRMAGNAQKALSAGITTLRDCGAKGYSIIKLREAINKNIIIGPRIVCSGMPLTITGGHCHFFNLEVDSKDEVIKALRKLVKNGVDFIKIMISGGNMTPGSSSKINQYSKNIVETVTEQAHMFGKKVSAHVHSTVSINDAVSSGVDVLDHCSWMKDDNVDYDQKTVEEIVAKGIYVCPAMGKSYILPPKEAAPLPEKIQLWETFQENRFYTTKKMYNSGVKIIAGTDAGCKLTEFDELWKTLLLMHEKLDMPKEEVVKSATSLAAEAIGVGNVVGTIEKGKKADIIFVDGCPYDDLSSLKRVVKVFKNGMNVPINRGDRDGIK